MVWSDGLKDLEDECCFLSQKLSGWNGMTLGFMLLCLTSWGRTSFLKATHQQLGFEPPEGPHEKQVGPPNP